MITVRALAGVLSAAILLAGCDPRTKLEQNAPDITLDSMRAEGKGAVVAELFFDNRKCYRGDIVLGTEDGRKITGTVSRRHSRAGPGLEFAGDTVSAGRHYILRLDCDNGSSQMQFASYRRKPAFLVSPIYAPLGSFTLNPGEVIYIGSLHAASYGKRKFFSRLQPAAIGIEDRSEQVRQTLRQTSPAMAESLVVRLAAPTGGHAGAEPAPAEPVRGQAEVDDKDASVKSETAQPEGEGDNAARAEKELCIGKHYNEAASAPARPWEKVPCD